MKKLISLALVLLMVTSIFAGCGQKETDQANGNEQGSQETKKQEASDSVSEDAESEAEVETLQTIKMMIDPGGADGAEAKAINQLLLDNGIQVEYIEVPLADDGEMDKLLVSLMAGESFDLVYGAEANLKPYYNAGVMSNMDELAEKYGYDVAATFGDYAVEFADTTYALPAFVDIACTFYNKKMFDEKGLAYPGSEDWTWDKFIEVGRQLSDPENDVYGAFMPIDWVHYNYMLAMQKGVSHYKADGTANYDDPAFKESVEFIYGLGDVHGVTPTFTDLKSKQLNLEMFLRGEAGMMVIGSWFTFLLKDEENWSRDWDVGLTTMPYPEGYGQTTSTVIGSYWVPTTSENPEAAFKAASILAENQYTLGYGRVPARIDLADEVVSAYINEGLAEAFLEHDGVTTEEIKKAWFNTDVKPFAEKVIGAGSVGINAAFVEEGQMYSIAGQDIDTTMKHIQDKANKAIQDDKDN